LNALALGTDCPLPRRSPKLSIAAAAAWLALAAQAQSTPPADRPALTSRPAPAASADPLDPQAQVPAVAYTSALPTYRRLGEDKRVPWTQANETVNRIGGWRSYAREAQQPDATSTRPAPPAGPAPVTGPATVTAPAAVAAPGAAASAAPQPCTGPPWPRLALNGLP